MNSNLKKPHFIVAVQVALRLRITKIKYCKTKFPLTHFLQMAGNPDQQEDNVDEQYQEEGEEEVRI